MSDTPWSAPDATNDGPTFLPLDTLVRLVQVQQGLYALLLGLSAALTLLFGDSYTDEALVIRGGVAMLLLLVAMLGLPVWATFHHKAASNLVALGIPLRHGPWAQVIWWFVPIFSLFKPYAASKELLTCSEPTADPDAYGNSGLPTDPAALVVFDRLPVWWMLFVAGNVIQRIANRVQLRGVDVPSVLVAVGPLLLAGAIVFYVQLVGRIATAQAELFAARTGGVTER